MNIPNRIHKSNSFQYLFYLLYSRNKIKKIYDDVVDMIGNTPVVRLNKIPKDEGVKCEIGNFLIFKEFLNFI
jgi:hypothetical protein